MRISDWSSDVCSSDLLSENAQMHPAGQQPVFLDGLGREEPVAPLGAPGGKVATAGQTTRLPHAIQHAIELRSLYRVFRAQCNEPLEGLAGNTYRAIGCECR